MKKKKLCLTGGALVEGVMIKNEGQYAMALRKGNSDIEIVHDVYKGILGRGPFAKIPVLRGVFALIDYLALTVKSFLFSSDFYEDNSKEEPGAIQKFMKKVSGKYHESVEMIVCITVALILSIGGFIVLPHIIAGWLGDLCIPSEGKMMAVEAVLRIAMIALYAVFFCIKKDFRRICRYHGAQHKVINCLERGEELTMYNVKTSGKFDKNCEISFLLSVFFVSFILFAFLRDNDLWIRIGLRVMIVPIVAAIFYELMLIAQKGNSGISKILQMPSKLLQNLYVAEPSDEMLEVAIESLQAVFDWRDYLGLPPETEKPETYSAYDYADNVSSNNSTSINSTSINNSSIYGDSTSMQESMYGNNYYTESSYNNGSYNYNMTGMQESVNYDNLGYADYTNGQYFVDSKGAHNPAYTDISDMMTKRPIDKEVTKQPGMEANDYSMYDAYMQNTGYSNYNGGYTGYDPMQYTGMQGQGTVQQGTMQQSNMQQNNMQQGNMYNQGGYNNGNYQDDDLKMLDRYFTDDNY